MVFLSYLNSALAVFLAAWTFFRRRTAASDSALACALVVVAAEQFCTGAALAASEPIASESWQQWRLWALGLLPATWVWFSLTYARGNAHEFLARWRWLVAGLALAPLVFAAIASGHVLPGNEASAATQLGLAGLGFHVVIVAGTVFALINFERTYRAAVGTIRWRIKFTLLGSSVLLLTHLYAGTQALLARGYPRTLELVGVCGTAIALAVIVRGLLRNTRLQADVYPSLSILQGSLTATMAGVYLLLVGMLAKLAWSLNDQSSFALKTFLILASLVLLAVVLQSDRFRVRLRHFISRHFQRPVYDYSEIWRRFSTQTAACADQTKFCEAVARITADTLQALTVGVWLVGETRNRLTLAASTSISPAKATELAPDAAALADILRHFEGHPEPLDIENGPALWCTALRQCHPCQFSHGGNRMCAPLLSQGKLIGLLLVGDRVQGADYPLQDLGVLKCLADQSAFGIVNFQLTERLFRMKEIESFQKMATFLVHDLKNAASTLNLTLENMRVHFSDPAFREDALRAMGKSVAHINHLISRIGQLREELHLRRAPCDLSRVAREVAADLAPAPAIAFTSELPELPRIDADHEQLRKVVLNLLLNAIEACDGRGEVRLHTEARNDGVMLSVSDNGCGISPEFQANGLFRPFRTTKKAGLGIGMYQSKLIVDAHGGTVSVESAVGTGTTFRIFLPFTAP